MQTIWRTTLNQNSLQDQPHRKERRSLQLADFQAFLLLSSPYRHMKQFSSLVSLGLTPSWVRPVWQRRQGGIKVPSEDVLR